MTAVSVKRKYNMTRPRGWHTSLRRKRKRQRQARRAQRGKR